MREEHTRLQESLAFSRGYRDNNNQRTRAKANQCNNQAGPSALTSSRFVISYLLPVTCTGSRNFPSQTRARART